MIQEHDFEPERGLPEPLPPGETVLWQGSPDWLLLARRAFHVRKVAVYFGLLLAWRVAGTLADGGGAWALAWWTTGAPVTMRAKSWRPTYRTAAAAPSTPASLWVLQGQALQPQRALRPCTA